MSVVVLAGKTIVIVGLGWGVDTSNGAPLYEDLWQSIGQLLAVLRADLATRVPVCSAVRLRRRISHSGVACRA